MDNRNRDRGTIKWTAMMLPKHVKLLSEWQAEYDFEELAHQIQIAFQTNSELTIQYWQNGSAFEVEVFIKELPQNSPYLNVLTTTAVKKLYIPHILKITLYTT
jgi:hypothetical protein